jgi:hypothetical protein
MYSFFRTSQNVQQLNTYCSLTNGFLGRPFINCLIITHLYSGILLDLKSDAQELLQDRLAEYCKDKGI